MIDGVRLSELNIRIIGDVRSPLEPFVSYEGRVVASMISNEQANEYLLAFDDKTIKLEAKNDLLEAEYSNNIVPYRVGNKAISKRGYQ